MIKKFSGALLGRATSKGLCYLVLAACWLVFCSQTQAAFRSTLIQTIDTSRWSPPSPDPSGIVYLPTSDTLLVSDAEVNEMFIYSGANVYETMLSGNLIGTWTTLPFSDEPTGVTFNPRNNHLFFSDDTGTRRVYELNPGADELYGTSDDIITSFKTGDFGSQDPEGVTIANLDGVDVLFIVDGVNREVYRVHPGPNGRFDGVPPAGDDQVTHFDTLSLGLDDPEGICFNPDSGTLYAVGKPSGTLFEITTDGALVQTIDISAANARKPAGLAYGPSSQNPAQMSIYIAARGVDNDSDPNENDGKIYEMSLPASTVNQAPDVSAGPDRQVVLPASAALDGTVTDDGLPNPPGTVTSTWSKVSGPGTVNFGNANAVDTSASFSVAGTYVLRLTANDSALSDSDEVRVEVTSALSSLSISDVTVTEGDSGTTNAVFTVTLTPASSLTVTVNYATADGSATTSDNDYQAISGLLTFAPNETSKPVTVVVNGDVIYEPNETFAVNLSNAVNATIGDNQGIATILNDDAQPPSSSLTISDVTVTEGNSGTTNAVFTVTLTPASSLTVTVNYATADGSATTANNDYQVISGGN